MTSRHRFLRSAGLAAWTASVVPVRPRLDAQEARLVIREADAYPVHIHERSAESSPGGSPLLEAMTPDFAERLTEAMVLDHRLDPR